MKVLLTGAGGFIGGAVAAACRSAGHDVVGVDAFIPQAHGGRRDARPDDARADDARPDDARPDVQRCDIRDEQRVCDLLAGVDVVCHQAAMVGAGVTAADLPLFASHNDLGTATLLAAMAAAGVGRLVLASSMVVYGDGAYVCSEHGQRVAERRRLEDLASGRFDVRCPECAAPMGWQPVDESAPLLPSSGYAASKVAQEHYAAAWARQTEGSVVALRYHNVYGPHMPADTPYSGVAAIFRSALEAGQAPKVYEDGGQMRDFVHVDDVARANVRSLDAVVTMPADTFAAYNISSGTPISIADVARLVGDGVSGPAVHPVTTGQFRAGDVRHIVASPEAARRELGFAASVQPADGLRRFATDPLRG